MPTAKTPKLTHSLCFLISGKAGTGKSWTSDLINKMCDEMGMNTIKVPFATGVKNTARYMGWGGQKDIKGRKLLQDIGRAGRVYDINLWVRQSFNTIESSKGFPYNAVFIDDWRFNNEVKYILDNEPLYKVIDIRIDAPDREVLVGTDEYNDVSETELDDFKFTYRVDNSLESKTYEDDVKKILEQVVKKYSY